MNEETHPIKSNRALHQMGEALFEGVAMTDNGGRLVFANRALEQLLGYEPEELLGVHWSSLFPEQLHHWIEAWQSSGVDGITRRFEASLIHQDGTRVPVMVNSRALTNGYMGRGTLCTFTDLRERYQLEARVQHLERLAQVGQNLSSVVHELSNSLTILSLQSRLLAIKKPTNPQMGENLEVIQDQTRQMFQMVDKLRFSAVSHQQHFEETDINALIQRTLALQVHQSGTAGIEIKTNLASDLPDTLADADKLQQVFINIIKNARQAITAAQHTGTLTIEAELVSPGKNQKSRIQIRFMDDGPGIPPDVLPRIFEPFFTTKDPSQGMGLGLSICKRIVQRHRGRIWAANNDAGGAVIYIELPLAVQEQESSTTLRGPVSPP